MRLLMIACTLLALAAPPALAADCATTAEADALKIAAMRQQLIAAALFCGEGDVYHRFAANFRGDLQDADAALKAFFARHGLADGAEAFTARAARLSDQERARDGASFCANTHALLTAAAAWRGSLAGFVGLRSRAMDTGGLCKAFPVPAARPRPRPEPPVRTADVRVVTVTPTARVQPAPARPDPEPLRAPPIVPAMTRVALTMPRLPQDTPLPQTAPEPPRVREYDRDAEERSWRAWDIAHRDDWREENAEPRGRDWGPPPPQGWYQGWYPPPVYYRRW
ncbi:MAG TPA: hypothetical protein VGC16_02350 [Rhizomicrobium sp.]